MRGTGSAAFGVTLLGTQVNVVASDAEDRAWLQEVLTPSFGIEPARAGEFTVEVMSDVSSPMPGLTQEVPCYAFETGLFRLPGRRVDGRLHVEHREWNVRLTLSGPLVRVAPTGPDPRLRSAALRAIQELAVAAARVRGSSPFIQLHASCLKWRGGAIAFLGAKEAGKTTTVAHLCASLPTPLIANDQILVSPDGVIGLPTPVTLRPDTWRRLPVLFRTIPDVDRPVNLTLTQYEHAQREHGLLRVPRFTRLSTPQFARELGTTLSGGAPLHAVMLIERDRKRDGFELRELTASETAQAMRDHTFGLTRSAQERTIFDEMVEREPGEAGARPAPPAPEGVRPPRGYRLHVGSGFLESAADARGLLEALARAEPSPA